MMGKVGYCITWFFKLLQMKFYICGYGISFFQIGILVVLGSIAGLIIKGLLTIFRRIF